jgi:hypothetical protein
MHIKSGRSRGGLRLMASALVAAVAGLSIAASVASAQQVDHHSAIMVVPSVPADIQVPDGSTLFRVGHAVGTQNYVCLPSATDFKFVLFTPQATLFDDEGRQNSNHYFSANPVEGGTIRATWQDARDSGAIWGKAVHSSADPDFVAPGAIPWVLLERVGAQDGPAGGDTLAGTTYIQRLNTTGGNAPQTGCASAADVGNQAFVPYTADYAFYAGDQ